MSHHSYLSLSTVKVVLRCNQCTIDQLYKIVNYSLIIINIFIKNRWLEYNSTIALSIMDISLGNMVERLDDDHLGCVGVRLHPCRISTIRLSRTKLLGGCGCNWWMNSWKHPGMFIEAYDVKLQLSCLGSLVTEGKGIKWLFTIEDEMSGFTVYLLFA